MNSNELPFGRDSNGQSSQAGLAIDTPQSVLGGTMIVTGTAVGAGMLSLPTISSGMWFTWSIATMLLTWFCMLHVSLFILEINLKYKVGASFDTFVTDILGPKWNLLNGILITFIFYILLYAYISGGGSIVSHTIQNSIGVSFSPTMAGMVFSLCLAFVVWLSTKTVDRLVTVLLVGMAISFLLSVGDLALSASFSHLDSQANGASQQFIFVFAALPFYLTSFGFQTTVPSLVKYYGKNPHKVRACLIWGSLLVFVIYLVWLTAAFGNLSRLEFYGIASEGGNAGLLVSTIARAGDSELLSKLLDLFANLAIVTSFLGVSLGLFDYIADKFKMSDSPFDRLKTSFITFLPPTIAGLVYPDGFIYAIGFAGLALALSACIIPPLMIIKSRKSEDVSVYRVWGGNRVAYFILMLGIIYASCHIFSFLELLPVYGIHE